MKKTEGQKNGEQKVPYVEGDAWSGLTKREHLSFILLQGMVTHGAYGNDNVNEMAIKESIKMADALLEALSKP
jgi:hypothetical protein